MCMRERGGGSGKGRDRQTESKLGSCAWSECERVKLPIVDYLMMKTFEKFTCVHSSSEIYTETLRFNRYLIVITFDAHVNCLCRKVKNLFVTSNFCTCIKTICVDYLKFFYI